MSDDSTKMIPVVSTITIRGEEIHIKHLKVGKLTAVLTIIRPFAHKLPKPGGTPSSEPIDFMDLIMEHSVEAVKLVSVILDKPVEWVNDLELDELILVLSGIVEVNLDFFIQNVLPSVSRAMVQLGNAYQSKVAIQAGQ